MKPRAVLLGAAVLAAVWASPIAAQEPTLASVLTKAGDYVAEFERSVSSIVAEERYSQQWLNLPRGYPSRGVERRRQLVSDFLLVKPPSADVWMQFRDVFEVDGASVHDRSDRLVKLFLEAPDSLASQLAAIREDSARYNIGNISRTANMPFVALVFLERINQQRFRFFRTNDRRPNVARDAFGIPGSAWVLRYEETTSPTMIRTGVDRDLPSHGRFWIDPSTGRVLASELVAENETVRGTIDVSFQSDASVAVLLPAAMYERCEGRRDGSKIDGVARYGRFRKFQVNVDEKLAPVKK